MNVLISVLMTNLHPSRCGGLIIAVGGFMLGLCASLRLGLGFGVEFLGGFIDRGVLIEVICLKSISLN